MKKVLSVVLTIVMVLSMLPAVALAAGEITVEATSVSPLTSLKAGDVVNVVVKLPAVGASRKLQFDLNFDSAIFDYNNDGDAANVLSKLAFTKVEMSGSDILRLVGAGMSNVTFDAGTVALTASFTVKEGAKGTAETFYLSGLNCGDGTVTASSAKTTVTIPVAATGVALEKETVELNIGATETLVATVAPNDATNKAVTWKSSDATIVSVDGNGKVTANKVGTATITVTTADGGFTDTCDVTVSCGAHTGGTATCMEKAQCSKCGASYGELADHAYGELIIQKDAVHTSTKLEAGMKAHYECSVCHKLFDESKAEKQEADLIIAAPTHSFAAEWKSNDTNHWHECACGAKSGDEAHHGGTATCTVLAVCDDCGKSYGKLADHVYGSEWTADGSQHWHACSCGDKKDAAAHTDANTDNKCDVCEATICEHTGTIGAVEAQPAGCTTDGVKAHYKCSTCGTLFSDAEGKNTVTAADLRIPAAHTLGEWIAEDPAECGVPGTKGHYVCSVCTKYIDADKTTVIEDLTIPALVHTGGKADCQNKAVCTLCEQPYGEVDPTNHVGGDMKFDANEHWGLCACGEQIDKEAHKGGAATCTAKAVCSVCAQEYGEIDTTAHDFVDGVCSHNDKHVQFDKEPGAKVEDVIEGLVSAEITVKQMVEGTLTTVADLTTLFKDGAISVAEGKLTYELLPAAPEGEYYVEIGEYLVMIVVEKADTDYDRPSRPTLTNDAVKKVIAMIDELPSAKKVTLDDEEDIEAARKAYDALSKANQAKVTNYEDLVEVEEALKALLATPEMPEINNPFVDVADDVYYTDAVLWAVENNITSGTGADTFSPNAICTRAQVVTFLWRAAGSPAPKSTEMPFTDVEAGAYYAAAVQWAVENNITGGTSATTFDPNGECTRGQIVTFLWRAEGYPAAAAVNAFADVAADAYYNAPVLWAVANGITNGTSATTFSPADSCTRAQVVTFLYRAMAK